MQPPFRAEHIGSLLRPAALLALRRQASRGEIDPGELTRAENAAIAEAVALQASASGFASPPTANSGAVPTTAISTRSSATSRRTP